MNRLSLFKGFSYFETTCHEHYKDVFVEIERTVQKCTRSLRKRSMNEEIANLHSNLKQIEDVPMPMSKGVDHEVNKTVQMIL